MLLVLTPSTQLDRGGYECRESEPHSFSSKIKVFPRDLQKLRDDENGR